jgi:hypothetical protein
MVKKGVYRDNKVHIHEPIVHALTGGDWEKGWAGTKSFGGYKVYDVERTMDWWPNANQEVEFELVNGKAIIKSLGKILKSEDADKYIGSF